MYKEIKYVILGTVALLITISLAVPLAE